MATKAYSMKKLNCKYLTPCIAAMLLCMACNKDPQIERVFFEFEMPFTITPGTDTVRVGDTLRMEANFSDSLYDVRSGRKIYLPDFNGFNIFLISNRISDSTKSFFDQSSAGEALLFQTFNLNQFRKVSEKYSFIFLSHINGYYNFHVEVIPKQKGVYSLMLANGGGGIDGKGFIELPSYLVTSNASIRRIPVVRQNRYIFNQGRTNKKLFRKFALPLQSSDSLIQFESTFTFQVF
jgi:hypothetical protein